MIRNAVAAGVVAALALTVAGTVSATAVQGGPSQGVYRVPVAGVCSDARYNHPISVKVGELCAIPRPLNRGGGLDPSVLSKHFQTIPNVYTATGLKVALRVY